MNSNGLVVIRIGKQVWMKIATDVDGEAAAMVGKALQEADERDKFPLSLDSVAWLVRQSGFRHDDRTVIVTQQDSFCGRRHGGGTVITCRKTFDNLRFNPLQDDGQNDHFAVIDLIGNEPRLLSELGDCTI